MTVVDGKCISRVNLINGIRFDFDVRQNDNIWNNITILNSTGTLGNKLSNVNVLKCTAFELENVSDSKLQECNNIKLDDVSGVSVIKSTLKLSNFHVDYSKIINSSLNI